LSLLFDHCHPTPYGYERLAAWTVDWLDEGGWLPPRR
jgi:lysophospholipase L1-like esterase